MCPPKIKHPIRTQTQSPIHLFKLNSTVPRQASYADITNIVSVCVGAMLVYCTFTPTTITVTLCAIKSCLIRDYARINYMIRCLVTGNAKEEGGAEWWGEGGGGRKSFNRIGWGDGGGVRTRDILTVDLNLRISATKFCKGCCCYYLIRGHIR